MSRAKIGSSAVAPPSSTAKRSSVIVARMSLVLQTNVGPGKQRT